MAGASAPLWQVHGFSDKIIPPVLGFKIGAAHYFRQQAHQDANAAQQKADAGEHGQGSLDKADRGVEFYKLYYN